MSRATRPVPRGAARRSGRPVRRKKPQPKSRAQRLLLRYGWLLPLGAILVGGGILTLTYAFASIPLPADIKLSSSAEVYDRHGKLIGVYSGEVRRFLIDTDELLRKKPYIGEAVIAAEDREFYDHNGVSARGIVRAAWANLTGGEVSQGGSTITQQYVKQAVLRDPSRTVTRKAKEAILAVKLERRYSKKQILGFYLNTIYLGRGAYGFEAAARTYFGHAHAEDLTLAQAAYLAGIIPAPNSYQPDDNQQLAQERRDRVVNAMLQEGFITDAQAERAMKGRIKLADVDAGSQPKDQEAAYFMEWLRKEYLYPEYEEELYTRGLKIHTTLDLEMQEMAETSIDEILTEKEDPQAALVSMTPSGAVRALVGGRDFTNVKKARGFNYATDYPGRQAGSAFKPFTLLTAIEEGISTQSRFSGSSPQQIPDPCAGEDGLPPWEVENYGGASYGSMTLDEATTNSVNTVYASLIQELGPEKVVDILGALQFDRDDMKAKREIGNNCGLALGILDVTPLEMARAYATFAARGRVPDITPITYIEDAQGRCIKEYRPAKGDCEAEAKLKTEQVVEQNSVDVLTQSLTHVVESGTATVANIGRPVAGKTGTTQNNGNAWFAGYTPQLATVVWEGYKLQPGPDGKFYYECGLKINDPDKQAEAQERCAEDDVIPEMRYCSDTYLCRPVHGYEVTGGGAPVSPAVMWADYMREAMADMEILEFPTPVDLPDEVINQAPTAPPSTSAPVPVETEEPTPEPEPSEEPTAEPTVEPSEGPTTEPTPGPIDPSPTSNGDTEGDP